MLLLVCSMPLLLPAQSLVRLAMNIHLEKDSIQAFAHDQLLLDSLLKGKYITQDDIDELKELDHFVSNPWTRDSIDISKLDVEVVYRVRLAKFQSSRKGFSQMGASPPKRRTRSLLGTAGQAAGAAAPQVSLTTKIIDGTAQFIADRFKEELTLAFFETFRQKVAASNELMTLLPNTSDLLLHQDIGAFLSIGATTKAAFQNDIQSLLYNFDQLVRTDPKYEKLANEVVYRAFMLTSKSIDLSRRGYSLPDVVRQLYLQEANQQDELGLAIRLGHAFVEGLTEVDSASGKLRLIRLAEYKLLESPEQREYFMALLFQRDRSLGDALIHSRPDFQQNFGKLNQLLQELIVLVQNADDERKRLQQGATSQELTNDVIFSYVGYTFEAIDLAARFAYFRSPQQYWQSEFYRYGLPLGRKVIRTAKAINANDHGTTLLTSIQIISDLLVMSQNENNAAYLEDIRHNLLLYGNFMVNVVNAESAEDVRRAIEAVALPVGSSRIKKNTLASISINAYPGLFVGTEWLSNAELPSASAATSFGFTAPIGLSFNWGLRRAATAEEIRQARAALAGTRLREVGMAESAASPVAGADSTGLDSLKRASETRALSTPPLERRTFRKGGRGQWQTLNESSLSLFLSIVDIGAVVSYRLSEDQSEGLPANVSLRQIFSPGIFVAYGFKRAPVSLMLGTQYTPELRKVEVNQLTTKANALRLSLTLAVDIPMFNLYAKPVPY
ncbi:MAG: hypothetical protein D6730_24870 [Bacteroidetes bacterium]|nr:MAG: hypothetical protein D6730_24870 [Bacteroidota bacterium]